MQTLEQLLSGQLAGATKLKLSCGLTAVPEEVFQLADTLEILDLSGNRLTELPAHFGVLKRLKVAFFSDNLFTTFPAVLAACPQLEMIGFKANRIAHIPKEALAAHLRWLILTDNCIEALPATIGRCVRLQKLMLAGNRLRTLPAAMAACTSLELLRISANQIEVLPEWVYALPALSWLAVAGNPFITAPLPDKKLRDIHWEHLLVTVQLGEGASGFVSRAVWQHAATTGTEKEVAIKLFKGEVTSDGWPAEEMNISIATGPHPHLVQVLGKIAAHPAQKQGLVFDLIPDACSNLGNPPSFASCTRDTFPADTVFSLPVIRMVATGIASAAMHLHAGKIMHGDLYCHNILTDREGHVLLVDYGAATYYASAAPAMAAALERLEVRAFGCLLDDLLTYADTTIPAAVLQPLLQLRTDCMQPVVAARPDFATVVQQLTALAAIAGN